MHIITFTDLGSEILPKFPNDYINCSDDCKKSQFTDEPQQEQLQWSQDINPKLDLESFRRTSQASKLFHLNKKRNTPANPSTGTYACT